MRAPGLVGIVQLAAGLALALPLGLFGVTWLLEGRTLAGAGFLALAALMLLLPWRLSNPLDPGDLAGAAFERVVGDEDEEE